MNGTKASCAQFVSSLANFDPENMGRRFPPKRRALSKLHDFYDSEDITLYQYLRFVIFTSNLNPP
jgi:hypothetical protein